MQIQLMLQDKRYLFWTLQFVGWSGWAISHYLGVMFWDEAPSLFGLYLLVVSTIGMAITLGLRALYHYMWEMRVIRRIVAILVSSYAAALLWFSIRSVIFSNVYGVKVPGEEGRAGMAALVLESEARFDGQAFYEWVSQRLPSYTRPLFVRFKNVDAKTNAGHQIVTTVVLGFCMPDVTCGYKGDVGLA